MVGFLHHGLEVLEVVQRSGHPIYGRTVVQQLRRSTLSVGCPICATNSSPVVQLLGREVAAWL